MAIIQLSQLLLLMASVVTNLTESKSLTQAEKKTTCGIRRVEGSDMMLTCYFYDNISALRKDFTVFLYKGQQSPKTVVSCEWSPEILCHVAPGYEYLYDIDVNHDHTNVRIPNAGAEHAGEYVCQVMGESDPGTCILTEEQTPTGTTSLLPDDGQTQSADEERTAASELGAAKDTPGGRLTKEDKQTGSQEDNTVVHVVPSVVASVLLSIIIAVIIALCRRRRQQKRLRVVHEGNDRKKTDGTKTLLSQSHTNAPKKPNMEQGEACPVTESH